jgi:hypothetical protein
MTDPPISAGCAPRRLQARLLTALLAITFAVFVGVCGHEFVQFDDHINIYKNPHVQGLTGENLGWMFSHNGYARRYMPLGWLSYAVDYQLFGLNPHVYHIGNLLLHLVNVALLFFLLKRLLLLTGGGSRQKETDGVALWCAALGALFWAVNPLRVENVAWASSRIYCVAFCFAALWLLAWLEAHEPGIAAAKRRLFYGISVAAYAASLLTYPLALFAPVVLFVLEIYPLRRMGRRLSDWGGSGAWPVWRDKIPFLAMSAGALALTFFTLAHTAERFRPLTLEEFPLLSRVMQAFYIWCYYVWKPWAPYDLAVSYMTLHAFDPLALRFVLSAWLVMVVTLALFFLRRRWPAAFALWLCHLVLLIPVLGLTEYPHSPYDRYSYLHGTLWSVALALLLRALWHRTRRGYVASVALAGTSMLFALLAWQQVTVWRDTIPLYQHLLAQIGQHPDRSRFDHVLGVHYLRAGLTNEAVASLQNAIYYELRRPDRLIFNEGVLAQSHLQLGDIYADQGRLEEALRHYQTAVQANPTLVQAVVKTGAMLASLNRATEAVPWLKEAVRMKPDSVSAYPELVDLLRNTPND